MSDEIIERNFSERSPEEQEEFLKFTWCNQCQQVDLGMKDAREYEQNSKIYITGLCTVCNSECTTEVVDGEDESDWND